MSDVESNAGIEKTGEDDTVTGLNDAVSQVLKMSRKYDGVVKGINQVVKAIEAKKAVVCFLAENCSEDAYKNLIIALCKEHGVPLVDVPESKTLGQWAGLFVTRVDASAKIVGASCVAITDYGEQSEAQIFLQNHIKTLA